MTLDQAGDALIDMIVRTCNGRLTAAEVARPSRILADETLSKRVT